MSSIIKPEHHAVTTLTDYRKGNDVGTYHKPTQLETLLAKLDYHEINAPDNWRVYESDTDLVAAHGEKNINYLMLGPDKNELEENIEALHTYLKHNTIKRTLLRGGLSLLAGSAIATPFIIFPYLLDQSYAERMMPILWGALAGVTTAALIMLQSKNKNILDHLQSPERYLVGKSAYQTLEQRAETF